MKKSAQTATEIKPMLQPVYISKFNRKLKALGKDTANSLTKEPSKPWWTHPRYVQRRKFAQRSKIPKKVSQEGTLDEGETLLSKFSSETDRDKDTNPSSPIDAIKITTIVEAIRRKKGQNARISRGTKNIQRIIGSKRSKRSSRESENRSSASTRGAREGRAFISSSRFPRAKRHYRDQRREILPTGTRATGDDLKVAASDGAIPSTVFYKRIWEYINGTRPHSDIVVGYDGSETAPRRSDDSTCIDQDRISASQSREGELRAVRPDDVMPRRQLYERIWDIINATRSTFENARASRTKRDATSGVPKGGEASMVAAASRPCENETDERTQTINVESPLDTTTTTTTTIHDATHAREASDPYALGFWAVADKIPWSRPEIPSDDRTPIPSSRANVAPASEVADLNEFPEDEVRDRAANRSSDSSDNSTKERGTDEAREHESREGGLTREENPAAGISSPLDPIEKPAIGNSSQGNVTPGGDAERYTTDEPTVYDPLNIPYVEVPDYSDQREDSLDKSNRSSSSAAAGYNEYDDRVEVTDEKIHDDDGDEFSSGSAERSAGEIESSLPGVRKTSLENGAARHAGSLNADTSRTGCTLKGNENSAVRADKYDAKSRDDDDDDASESAEDSAESALVAERENSTADYVSAYFDINEYAKPFDLDDFVKNEDPLLEKIRVEIGEKLGANYDDGEEGSDRGDEFVETKASYAAYPKERQPHDYFTGSEDFRDDFRRDFHDGVAFDDRDEGKGEARAEEEKEAKDSEVMINEDYYPYGDKDFFKRFFEGDKSDGEAADTAVDTEREFLSRYFTEDVLRKIRENSTAEEDRKREESRNKEDVHKILSKILDKKDRFSRLDENLDELVEKGETVPIRYSNFWSLEYKSPRTRNDAAKAKEIEV